MAKQRKGPRPEDPDPTTHENLPTGLNFLQNFLSMKANDVGHWAGTQGVGQKVLGAFEQVFGKVGTENFVFPGLATILREPQVVKDAVRKAGLSPQVNHLIDTALDDLVEGARQAYRNQGRLTQKDLESAARQAGTRLDQLLAQPITYPQALQSLSPDEQIKFQKRLADLGEDRRQVFEALKARIAHPRDLKVLLLLPDDQWVPHLEQKYGEPKRQKTVVDRVGDFVNLGLAVDARVRKEFGDEQRRKKFLQGVGAARAWLRKRR